MLALKEILHSKLKFGMIMFSISLIVALTVVLSAFSEGLVSGMTGAIGELKGDVVVFQGDTYLTLERSVLTPKALATIKANKGVRDAYGLGHVMVSVDSSKEAFDGHVFGLEKKALDELPVAKGSSGGNLKDGQVIIDKTAESKGVKLEDVLHLEPTGVELKVVGFIKNRRFVMAPVFYTTMNTWEKIRLATLLGRMQESSEQQGQAGVGQTERAISMMRDSVKDSATIAVADLEEGTSADDLEKSLGEEFDVEPVREAALSMKGMPIMLMQVNGMEFVSLFIGAIVIGVFFYIITLNKAAQIAAVNALGASSGYLYRQLLLQITLLVTAGAITGTLLALGSSKLMPPTMGFDLKISRWAMTISAVYLTAYIGSLFSLRSILKIDPATALDAGEH
jgi:putative ABC transport system permease protein